jgi:hypothetical protein
VPVAVVDGLEVVQIDEEDGQDAPGPLAGEVRREPLAEQVPVRKRRQLVVERLMLEQGHQRLALAEAIAQLTKRVGQTRDDEHADEDAADEVGRRIDGLAAG